MSALAIGSVRRVQCAPEIPALKRVYRCQCGRPVFFGNTQCLECGFALGYDPYAGDVFPLVPSEEEGLWNVAPPIRRTARSYRRCANLLTPASCNWIYHDSGTKGDQSGLCTACRLNRMIPDLSFEENAIHWGRIEAAKRRVLSLLVSLGLPVASRLSEDPERGLAFDFLASLAGEPVMTGHADGVITLNVAEADDATRERTRAEMREPYRTLVGHFRHELGHYYWYRLVADSPKLLDGFREVFGDEREDYAAALRRNYSEGPRPDWQANFVSSYASVHPWEDWAETWAHYLHMIDAAGTAASFGLHTTAGSLQFDRFTTALLYKPRDPGAAAFLSQLNSWVELTAIMNELSRSMGGHDLYPFALPKAAVSKLQFIHMVACGANVTEGSLKPVRVS